MPGVRIICLPTMALLDAAADTAPPRCMVADDDGVRDLTGTGDGEFHRTIAIVPAADAPVRWVDFPDASPAQAATLARLAAIKTSLGEPAALHVVAGMAGAKGFVPVAITTQDAMRRWNDWLAVHDLTPDTLIPVAAIMPPPGDEQVWMADVAGEKILRTRDHGFPSDPALDDKIAAGRPITALPDDVRDAALVAALSQPPIDLLTGPWRRAHDWGLTAAMRGWLLRLAGALLFISLIIPLVYAYKLNQATNRADRDAVEIASAAGIAAPSAQEVETALDRKLAASGGGLLGLSVPAAGLFKAMQAVPGVTLRRLSHQRDGTLSATLASPRIADINQLLLMLQARGYVVTAQSMAGMDGQQMAMLTVRALP